MSANHATDTDTITTASEAMAEFLYSAACDAFGKRQVKDLSTVGSGCYNLRIQELVHAATNQAYDDVYREFSFQIDVPNGKVSIKTWGFSKTFPINVWDMELTALAVALKDMSKHIRTPAASWQGEDDTPSLQETHWWAYTER